MPVVAADLISPKGELQPAWFGDLPTMLGVWIPLGEAQVPAGATTEQADRVTTAYVYWRAFKAKSAEMAGTPNRQNTAGVEFNEEYTKEQRAWFEEQTAYWSSEISAALVAASPPVAVAVDNPPRASFSQPFSVSF